MSQRWFPHHSLLGLSHKKEEFTFFNQCCRVQWYLSGPLYLSWWLIRNTFARVYVYFKKVMFFVVFFSIIEAHKGIGNYQILTRAHGFLIYHLFYKNHCGLQLRNTMFSRAELTNLVNSQYDFTHFFVQEKFFPVELSTFSPCSQVQNFLLNSCWEKVSFSLI